MAQEKESWLQSLVNDKRPALEGIVEDMIGPPAVMDEVVYGKPLPPEKELFHIERTKE